MNRAAVLQSPGHVVVEERERPAPRPSEVVVQVLAVGVCGSDVHYFEHGRIGDFVVEAPLVLGHEASGLVVEIGSAVAKLRIGDRVAIEPGFPCSQCEECRTGRYNLCPSVRFLATPPIDGAFAEYIAVPEAFAHPVTAALSDNAAALIEPLAVGVWANLKANTSPHTSVLVTGAGPIGLLTAAVARSRGARELFVSDVSEERVSVARSLGFVAGSPDDPAFAAFRPNVHIECSGAASAVDAGIRSLAPGGCSVLVGMASRDTTSLPTATIQAKELNVKGTFRYANVYPVAIALATAKHVDLDAFVGAEYELDHVAEALRATSRDPRMLKVIVRPTSAG